MPHVCCKLCYFVYLFYGLQQNRALDSELHIVFLHDAHSNLNSYSCSFCRLNESHSVALWLFFSIKPTLLKSYLALLYPCHSQAITSLN